MVYVNSLGPKPWAYISDIFDYEGEYIETNISTYAYANESCSVAYSIHSVNPYTIVFMEVVADGSNKPIQAYENTENKCGSQFVGVYTSTLFSVSNAIAFLSAVGLAHW